MEDELLNRITINPDICFGKPTVRNMRYPVEMILDLLSSGIKSEEILKDYPDLDEKDIQACVLFASKSINGKNTDWSPENFNKQKFDVLRGAYWLKWNLISQDDITLYETIQFHRNANLPFTTDNLAKRLKIGRSTLRQRLDNLENAGLLEINKTEGPGNPNNYVLKEPYYERDSIKVTSVSPSTPRIFLEDMIISLRRDIRENKAAKRRLLEPPKFQLNIHTDTDNKIEELRITTVLDAFLNEVPKIHESVFIAEDAVVIGSVEIGEQSSVWYGCILRGDVNFIRIGERTNIQDATVIHVSSKTNPTILEDEITVGHRVTLHGCRVESNCLIGIGSIILDGARIGRHSLVAAGSLVTPGTQVPPRSLVMGSPAKVKRELTDEEVEKYSENWKNYVKLSKIYLEGA